MKFVTLSLRNLTNLHPVISPHYTQSRIHFENRNELKVMCML